MLTVYKNKNECCGCGLCEKICIYGAIEMVYDEHGFLYPKIDPIKCVNCGICIKKCTFSNKEKNRILRIGREQPEVYAAYSKKNICDSTSGGVASALSEEIIRRNGVVYGAVWNENCRKVYHKKATTIEGLEAFKSSKYVQSDKQNIFESVHHDLKNEKLVLFIGLPCEIAGLKSYLEINYVKLITISLICHAVASFKYLDIVLSEIEKKYGSTVCNLNMRYKDKGEVSYAVKIIFNNKKEIILKENDFFFHPAFLGNYITRPSCGNCAYKGFPQFSDITLGDYWGLPESHSGYNRAGVSALLINTSMGKKFFKSATSSIVFSEGNLASLSKVNKRLCTSVDNGNIFKFYKLLTKYGALESLHKIAILKRRRSRINSLKFKIKSIVKNIVKLGNI